MKKLFIYSLFCVTVGNAFAQNNWHIAGDKITTQWAADVKPDNVLPA